MSEQPAKTENVSSASGDAVAELVPLEILPEDKKGEIRSKVWKYLDNNKLTALFPAYRKISNFKGADAAGDLVATLDVFKNAKCVKVDPDKPLQQVRFVTLKAGKTLLVPTPRQRTGLLSKITPPADCDDETLIKCSTRQGVREGSSVNIELDEHVTIDLVVVGCVAVSTKGWRIGKGYGYSDLEYAMLASVGYVNPSVPVVTIVHDCQVLDLPESLFDQHDVAVDFIVTPTRVIQCSGARPRPAGINWSLLAPERLDRIRILKRLRYREWKAGKNVCLTGETENPAELTDEIPPADEEFTPRRRMNNRRRPRKPRAAGDEETGGEGAGSQERKDVDRPPRRGRGGYRGGRGRRRPPMNRDGENRTSENERDGETSERDEERGGEPRRGSGRRFVVRRRKFRRSGPENGERREGGRSEDDEGRDSDHPEDGQQRRRGRRSDSDGAGQDGERRRGGGGGGPRRPYRPMGGRRPYYGDCEGSVYVGALPRSLRVSEFKAEVRDRNVQPLRVIWRGSSGYAFLGFRTMDEAEVALESLNGLSISDNSLRLEMAKSSGNRRRRRDAPPAGDGAGDEHGPSDDGEE